MEKDLTGEIVEIIANNSRHSFTIGQKAKIFIDLLIPKDKEPFYVVSLDDSVGWFLSRSDFKL